MKIGDESLDSQPVHVGPDDVVVRDLLDGSNSGHDGTPVINVLEAGRSHGLGIHGLQRNKCGGYDIQKVVHPVQSNLHASKH